MAKFFPALLALFALLSFLHCGDGDLVNHLKDADVHRAGDGALAASYTEILAKAFLVINKLMKCPLPPATVFHRSRVMAAGHKCEISIVA